MGDGPHTRPPVGGSATPSKPLGGGGSPKKHDGLTGPPGTVLAKPDAGVKKEPKPAPSPKKAPAAEEPLRVIIVEPDMTRLNDGVRDAARNAVEMELRRVRGGFKVNYFKSGIASATKDLGLRDFLVYVMPKRDTTWVFSRLKGHLTIAADKEKKVVEEVSTQLAKEGGACVKLEKKSVSFVGTDMFEGMLGGPMSDDERKEEERHVGECFAMLVLHELGHAMDAEHGDKGLMVPRLTFTTDVDAPMEHYTKPSITKMTKFLDALP